MGKQINYYMGYEDFLLVAQEAINCGCTILKKENGKMVGSNSIDAVTRNCRQYYFYWPDGEKQDGKAGCISEMAGGYNEAGNVTIEAGFSRRDDAKKEISKGRLFVISGYYDAQGSWIPRPDYVTKVYNKLVRAVKKIAPYTELTDILISTRDEDYLQEYEWKRKEYITQEYLRLREIFGYRLK